jgi:hypothetical protein
MCSLRKDSSRRRALRHHRLQAPHKPISEVYQSSTINALLEGVYNGDMTYLAIDDNSIFTSNYRPTGLSLQPSSVEPAPVRSGRSGNSNKESHQGPTRLTGGESRDPVS